MKSFKYLKKNFKLIVITDIKNKPDDIYWLYYLLDEISPIRIKYS